jgi:small subunit ribosomal protein S16
LRIAPGWGNRLAASARSLKGIEMALKIRLQRHGSKNAPFYHVVVTDSRNARNGRFIEKVGYYTPTKEPSIVELNGERISHWYNVGARPSDCVANLLRIKKIELGKK